MRSSRPCGERTRRSSGGTDYLRRSTSPLSVPIMEGADVAIHVFRRWLSLSSIDLSLVWDWSVSVFALTWFQPVLLRLDRKRGVAWIVGFTAWPAIVGLLFGFDWEYVHFAHFMFAISALTAVLLLKGQRTRPWLGVIAAFSSNSQFCMKPAQKNNRRRLTGGAGTSHEG